jgi:hypothetical protein
MDRAARGAGVKKGHKAAQKTRSHRPSPKACIKGRLCIDKPGALLKRVGALQKDIALLKTLAIPLRNIDLQLLRPFSLYMVDASVMPTSSVVTSTRR